MNTNNEKFEITQNCGLVLNAWRCPTETRMHLICAIKEGALHLVLDINGEQIEVNNNSADEMISLFDDCGENVVFAGFNFVCNALRWIEDHTSDEFKEKIGDAAFLRFDAESAFDEWKQNFAQ